MLKRAHTGLWATFLALASLSLAEAASAQDRTWAIGKVTGEVWVSGPELTPVALDKSFGLASGHEIRTGRTGRVLLTRGEEKILIAPNSVLALPEQAPADEGKTTIYQRAGEIVLTVEKRNAPHFEVQTPYLAALVKGTEFKVSVGPGNSRVDVLEGKVEVADFKSGQLALVLPGQTAKVAQNAAGLKLSGAGTLSPIVQGSPRASSVTRVPVPKGGLSKPADMPLQQRAKLQGQPGAGEPAVAANKPSATKAQSKTAMMKSPKAVRISQPIGLVRLDAGVATKGFARSGGKATSARGQKGRATETVFSTNALSPGNGAAKKASPGNSGNANNAGKAASGSSSSSNGASGNAGGNGNGNGNAAAGPPGLTVAAAASGNGNGNGMGNSNGNGNGNGRGRGRSR